MDNYNNLPASWFMPTNVTEPDFFTQWAENIKYSGSPLSTLTDRIAQALMESYKQGFYLGSRNNK